MPSSRQGATGCRREVEAEPWRCVVVGTGVAAAVFPPSTNSCRVQRVRKAPRLVAKTPIGLIDMHLLRATVTTTTCGAGPSLRTTTASRRSCSGVRHAAPSRSLRLVRIPGCPGCRCSGGQCAVACGTGTCHTQPSLTTRAFTVRTVSSTQARRVGLLANWHVPGLARRCDRGGGARGR